MRAPLGYTFSNGTALCADCATDLTDPDTESGEAYAVYDTEEAHDDMTCDECEQVIQEKNTEDNL